MLFLKPVKSYLKAMRVWSTLFLVEGCFEAPVVLIQVIGFAIQIDWRVTPCPAPVHSLHAVIFQNCNKRTQKKTNHKPKAETQGKLQTEQ